MANMEHCRFQNTLGDLEDCYVTLANDDVEELSLDERIAMRRLIDLCGDISGDFNYLIESD